MRPSELQITCPCCFEDVKLPEAVSRSGCRHFVCKTCLPTLGSWDTAARFSDNCIECQRKTEAFSHCLKCARFLANQELFPGCISCPTSSSPSEVIADGDVPCNLRDFSRQGAMQALMLLADVAEGNNAGDHRLAGNRVYMKACRALKIVWRALKMILVKARIVRADPRYCSWCHYGASIQRWLLVDIPMSIVLMMFFSFQFQVLEIASGVSKAARDRHWRVTGRYDRGPVPQLQLSLPVPYLILHMAHLLVMRLRNPHDGTVLLIHAITIFVAFLWEVEFHTWIHHGLLATSYDPLIVRNPWARHQPAWQVFPNSLGGLLAQFHTIALMIPWTAALTYMTRKRWLFQLHNALKFVIAGFMAIIFVMALAKTADDMYKCPKWPCDATNFGLRTIILEVKCFQQATCLHPIISHVDNVRSQFERVVLWLQRYNRSFCQPVFRPVPAADAIFQIYIFSAILRLRYDFVRDESSR
jgi:hypothetical protein